MAEIADMMHRFCKKCDVDTPHSILTAGHVLVMTCNVCGR